MITIQLTNLAALALHSRKFTDTCVWNDLVAVDHSIPMTVKWLVKTDVEETNDLPTGGINCASDSMRVCSSATSPENSTRDSAYCNDGFQGDPYLEDGCEGEPLSFTLS